MSKKILLLFLFFCTVISFCHAQTDAKILKNKIDSIYDATGIDSLKRQYYKITRHPSDYIGFNIGGSFSIADLKLLNAELTELGLNEINESFGSFSEGISWRSNRLLNSFDLFIVLPNTSKNDQVNVRVYSVGFLHWKIGFDLLNMERLHLYPQVGLFHQSMILTLENKLLDNDSVSAFSDLSANYQGTIATKHALGYSYGVELNYVLSKNQIAGIALALGYTVNDNLVSTDFFLRNKKTNYQTESQLRASEIYLGFKFFGFTRDRNKAAQPAWFEDEIY